MSGNVLKGLHHKRLGLFREYLELTKKIDCDNPDSVEECLNKRRAIIEQVNGVNEKIRSAQGEDVPDEVGEMVSAADKIIAEIQELDKKINEKLIFSMGEANEALKTENNQKKYLEYFKKMVPPERTGILFDDKK